MQNHSGEESFSSAISAALYPVESFTADVRGDDDPSCLSSCFDVTGLAVASIGAACAEIAAVASKPLDQQIIVSPRLASLWFDMTIRPQGWQMPPIWDAIAGIYRTQDRWIRLHTNAPHHRQAALGVLSCDAIRENVETQVAKWTAEDLEREIVDNGGCAALMRSMHEWDSHPQGVISQQEPLIAWKAASPVPSPPPNFGSGALPLQGLRVLDCTRVLAGPVCTRLLAAYGADVLRIDPPGWDEANVEPEITVGKRLCTLDLKTQTGRQRFEELFASADVFIHGYRSDALDRLGLSEDIRRFLNPGIIDVALSAYGWSGPWATRRGFDSLVQMSSGIVHEGMIQGDGTIPTPLPVQALDHATGYLMAAAAVRALRVRQEAGKVLSARLSLVRTSTLLKGSAPPSQVGTFVGESSSDLAPLIERTFWGPAKRVRFPVIAGLDAPNWSLPARPLHSDAPRWAS